MNPAGFEIVDCGFCSEDTPCMCRDAAAAVAASAGSSTGHASSLPSQAQLPISAAPTQTASISVDSLPSYAPAVPLRRSTKPKPSSSSVMERWIVNPAPAATPQPTSSLPTRTPNAHNDDGDDACTGDPANCPACADDPANQAFCAALGDAYSGGEGDDDLASSATATPPPTTARRAVHFVDDDGDVMGMDGALSAQAVMPAPRLSVLALCCGDPKLCGGGCHDGSAADGVQPLVPLSIFDDMDTEAPIAGSSIAYPPRPPSRSSSTTSSKRRSRSQESKNTDMVPCNTAWAQLSSHPNIAFADLSLLADVVARRDHIHVDSSSASGSSGSANASRTAWSSPSALQDPKADLGSLATSTNPTHSTVAGNTRTLVPHDHLVMNGLGQRRRVRQVPNDGVQDALALLDGVRTLT